MSEFIIPTFQVRDPDAPTAYALSMEQPWLYCILHRGKRIENRNWMLPQTVVGQRIYLHATSTIDQKGYEDLTEWGVTLPEEYEVGAILGSCVVGGFVTQSDDPWFSGPYGILLRNVKVLDEPIVTSGDSRLWEVVPWWEDGFCERR